MRNYQEEHQENNHQQKDNMNINKIEKALTSTVGSAEGITRKEAIKRMGKYAAVTALGAYIILNPMKAQAASAPAGSSEPANPNTTGQSPFD